jgi:hypothetical protein
MTKIRVAFFALVSASLMVTVEARAEVTSVEIAARSDVRGGKPFGSAGGYEKLVGKVYFSVDPTHPRNKPIVDLDKGPRDGGHCSHSGLRTGQRFQLTLRSAERARLLRGFALSVS